MPFLNLSSVASVDVAEESQHDPSHFEVAILTTVRSAHPGIPAHLKAENRLTEHPHILLPNEEKWKEKAPHMKSLSNQTFGGVFIINIFIVCGIIILGNFHTTKESTQGRYTLFYLQNLQTENIQ